MSQNKVLIFTQYEENYGFHEGNFHWKPKGSHIFQIEIDSDLFFYTDPRKIFEKMLESQNSNLERFTYVDHEIQFQEPTTLGNQEEYLKINKELENEEPNHVIGGTDFSESINQLNNLSIIQ